MEAKKEAASSSSFASHLKDSSSPSSSALFDSIFPPPSKDIDGYNMFSDCLEDEDKSQNPKTNMNWKPFYNQQQVPQPCHLSSSIYYGGQDIYINPPRNSKQCDKDEEDDGMASRGNWWEGSLYY